MAPVPAVAALAVAAPVVGAQDLGTERRPALDHGRQGVDSCCEGHVRGGQQGWVAAWRRADRLPGEGPGRLRVRRASRARTGPASARDGSNR